MIGWLLIHLLDFSATQSNNVSTQNFTKEGGYEGMLQAALEAAD